MMSIFEKILVAKNLIIKVCWVLTNFVLETFVPSMPGIHCFVPCPTHQLDISQSVMVKVPHYSI